MQEEAIIVAERVRWGVSGAGSIAERKVVPGLNRLLLAPFNASYPGVSDIGFR